MNQTIWHKNVGKKILNCANYYFCAWFHKIFNKQRQDQFQLLEKHEANSKKKKNLKSSNCIVTDRCNCQNKNLHLDNKGQYDSLVYNLLLNLANHLSQSSLDWWGFIWWLCNNTSHRSGMQSLQITQNCPNTSKICHI